MLCKQWKNLLPPPSPSCINHSPRNKYQGEATLSFYNCATSHCQSSGDKFSPKWKHVCQTPAELPKTSQVLWLHTQGIGYVTTPGFVHILCVLTTLAGASSGWFSGCLTFVLSMLMGTASKHSSWASSNIPPGTRARAHQIWRDIVVSLQSAPVLLTLPVSLPLPPSPFSPSTCTWIINQLFNLNTPSYFHSYLLSAQNTDMPQSMLKSSGWHYQAVSFSNATDRWCSWESGT